MEENNASTTTPENGIGWAVKQLHYGQRVARAGWNGKRMYLELQVPDEHSEMTEPYVYLKTPRDEFIPWNCSQADMLAIDWTIA